MTRLELRFGAPVLHGGKKLGSLGGVVLDATGRRWEGLIVRRGLLRRTHWIVPRSEVCDASDEQVVLDAAPTTQVVEPASLSVSAGTRVRTRDGRRLGRLALLLVRADGRLLHVVIERRTFGLRRMVPAEMVTAVEAGSLLTDLASGADALMPYRPDRDLAVLARWAIERLGTLGRFDGLSTRVSATDGVVILDGHVTSRLRAAQIEAVVLTVPGVLGVENRLVSDDELTIALARELRGNARTRDHLIRAAAHRGVITLEGRTPDAKTAETAAQIAASMPGVLRVVNRMRAPGFRPGPGWTEKAANGKPEQAQEDASGAIGQVVIDLREGAPAAKALRGGRL
jgi:osmotically-inducible protein OsmY